MQCVLPVASEIAILVIVAPLDKGVCMNTVLVVEDEKLIRQGIATMIKRTGVPVKEVIECANGLQAMEVLREKKIDVMFTDIRMPKMNGIELVQAMQELQDIPLTVAVSGYDDFSYAVDMMRQGVREYILKPVERDKLKEVMEKLEEELSKRRDEEKKTEFAGKKLIKYLLMDDEAAEEDLETISRILKSEGGDKYFCFVTCEVDPALSLLPDIEPVSGIDGMEIYILGENREKSFEESLLENKKRFDSYGGMSELCTAPSDLKKGYMKARERREDSFCRCVSYYADQKELSVPKALLDNGKKLCEKEAVSARVQLIGTGRKEDLLKEWNGFFTAVKRGQIKGADFAIAMEDFAGEYLMVYKKKVPAELLNPFSYLNLDGYSDAFLEFVEKAGNEHETALEGDQNKHKLEAAIKYIRENYTSDLNMAVVSNEVSMNYSLFSTAFKNYTGTNFVNFIRDLRINEAKRLLSETDLRIYEIASKVGYDNDKHFMKSFKMAVGVSPKEYRKNMI